MFYFRIPKFAENKLIYVIDSITPLLPKSALIDDFNEYNPSMKINNSFLEHNIASVKNLIEFLSPSYFQASIKSLTIKKMYVTNKKFEDDKFVLRDDGSYSLASPGSVNDSSVKAWAKIFIDNSPTSYFCDSCSKMSDKYKYILKIFFPNFCR